jgi:UDP-4-amino-4,6-dideoxy-L-N-acetyl-beta-L-altrosamine transaminase
LDILGELMITQILPYAKQSISTEDLEKVTQALQNDLITRSTQVEAFENEMAAYCGARYAVAFSSGSAGLAAAFFAAQVSAGDRIITTPNTFVSTVGTALSQGGQPIFVDLELETGAVNALELALNANQPFSRGKTVIVPVHFAGLPVDLEYLDQLLAVPESIVIEDAAHAIGSSYPRGGPKVGSCAWSDMTVFSLHPAKTMTTGEGGVVTTNNDDLHHSLKRYRNNGIERDPQYLTGRADPWYYEVHELTNNYNFTDFQAALGRSKLKRLDQFVSKRRELMQAYREDFKGIESIKLFTSEFDHHTAFHLCVTQIDFDKIGVSRAQIMDALKQQGIGTQVHYIPLYRHPAFAKQCGDIARYFPKTEKYYEQTLTLPLFYDMEKEDVHRVTGEVKKLIFS